MSAYYFAAQFIRHPEMRQRRDELVTAVPGAVVTSRWIDLHGGGDVEDMSPDKIQDHPERAVSFALDDLADVDAADTVVSFTREGGGGRGGRHVEYGYALATGKRMVIIGPRENIFHCYPKVETYESWAQFLAKETQ